MFKGFRNWFDERTNYRKLVAPIRRRVLPTGPSWGYTTANCVLWLLVIEVITGFLLMGSYSASSSSAWASVHFIEQAPFGSFIRGMHYWCAQALLVMFAVHTIRVLLSAAFRAPRELIWGTGLILIPMFVLWAITGNPLSGSQTGASQIEVEGNILGSTPLIGPVIQRILIGGAEVGQLTLTHLYFLHAGLFPLAIGILLAFHLAQVYRHGSAEVGTGDEARLARPYFPDQTVRNMIVLSIVLGVVAVLALTRGAPLDAPADPELPHSPRPEWYFLFLFELRAYFVGDWEFIATMVIPSAALLLLFSIPTLDKLCPPKVSAVFRYFIVTVGVIAWTGLTLVSVVRDSQDEKYQASRSDYAQLSARARQLADLGKIPPEGAFALLHNDSETQGPKLFIQHCSSCHSHADEKGQGIVAEDPSAPNLFGFASESWWRRLLDPEKIASDDFFGNTVHGEEGQMLETIESSFSDLDEDGIQERDDMIAALVAEADLVWHRQDDAKAMEDGAIERGTAALSDSFDCTSCHKFGEENEEDDPPNLTAYGSSQWLSGFIADPGAMQFYGEANDRMPAFAKHRWESEKNLLTEREIDILVRWLRGDDRFPSAKDNNQQRPN